MGPEAGTSSATQDQVTGVRAVLDANVYVSAAIHPAGPPGRILERCIRDGAFELVASSAIADEVSRALAYPNVRKHLRPDLDAQSWLEYVLVLADLVAGEPIVEGVCADPDDDKYVAAALEGRAHYIVSGDRPFLNLRQHKGVQIVSPRTFLEILDAS